MGSGTATVDHVERLNRISERRLIDPDRDLPGTIGDGQLLPDELLSVHGLDVELTTEQRRLLSREEVASILDNGIRFEAVLEAGFALQVALAERVTDPRITYMLHEIGEETRHQRLFQRVIHQIDPQARNPLQGHWLLSRVDRYGEHWIIDHAALLHVMVLAGEEIPDLFQKRASEHPDTDPFLAEVNRYHRQEEARHLSYARSVLPEVWAKASWVDRFQVHHVAPAIIRQMFSFLVQPGVYETVGLDGWATWKAVNHLPERLATLAEGTRPVLQAVLDAGIVAPNRVPTAWQKLCQVDRSGRPQPAATPSAT